MRSMVEGRGRKLSGAFNKKAGGGPPAFRSRAFQ